MRRSVNEVQRWQAQLEKKQAVIDTLRREVGQGLAELGQERREHRLEIKERNRGLY